MNWRARAFDTLARIFAKDKYYPKDLDPRHWKTINGSHVHLDKNGNYNGGAGGKFNGQHYYGKSYKEKGKLMSGLAEALRKGAEKKQQENHEGKSFRIKFGPGIFTTVNPVKGNPNQVALLSPGEGPKIIDYPGGVEAFLNKARKNGLEISETKEETSHYIPLPNEAGYNGRVGRQQARSSLKGRPQGAQ